MSIIEIARIILEKEGKELHFREIAERAMILDKSIGTDLEICATRFSTALSGHIARNERKPTALFKRIPNGKGGFKSGFYALKKKSTPKLPNPTEVLNSPVSNGFTGKAGEYGVFSELLYWGYNPAMMVVDHGVDIVASKDGDYFHIQVKTANPNASKNFSFKITKSIFEMHENSKTFYVFVIRREIKGRPLSDYVILPSSQIRHIMELKIISCEKDISINISIDNNTFKINGEYEITGVNDFSRTR